MTSDAEVDCWLIALDVPIALDALEPVGLGETLAVDKDADDKEIEDTRDLLYPFGRQPLITSACLLANKTVLP